MNHKQMHNHNLNHLVIVCCHAVYDPNRKSYTTNSNSNFSSRSAHSPIHSESAWLLQPFQQSNPACNKPGEHETFIAHIKAGLDLLQLSDHAGRENAEGSSIKEGYKYLVFSGGYTKPNHITTRSEAESYYEVMLGILKEEKKEKKKKKMQAVEKFAPTTSNRTSSAASTSEVDGSTLISNVLIEDLATDSFQNLLFSILKYREATGVYPYHITVVTHDFKKRRFLDLHAGAIRWPADRITVVGIDPDEPENVRANTLLSETRNGYRLWSSDPYGIKPPLSTKRAERGWVASHLTNLLDGLARGASRRNPTEETDGGGGDDAVMGLLNWTGGESGHEIFGVVLPWEKS